MTNRLAPRIGLADKHAKVRLKETHSACRVITGLFLAPTFLSSDADWEVRDGGTRIIELRRVESTAIFTVVNKYAHAVEHMHAEVSEQFKVVGEGRTRIETTAGAYGHWYLVDKSTSIVNSLLDGYDGFCFVGNANTVSEMQHGFIPFSENEIMIDADGRKFLIIKGGD